MERRHRRPFIPAFFTLSIGLLAGVSVDRALRIEARPQWGAGSRAGSPGGEGARLAGPLPLRLVDTGGVGIPADRAAWGHDYSHNTWAFHDLILPGTPYVDDLRFRQVRSDWERYLDRMAAYGNNGVVVGTFLELVDFDRVAGGQEVYGAASPYRARHRVLRGRFAELFRAAKDRGFRVFLRTDMPALTEPLARYFRSRRGGLDPHWTETWAVYRAGLEELFTSLPEVDGIVVRIGEAGPLFNRPGWPYWGEYGVRDGPGLRAMLEGLLPAFEEHGKLLVLRSWSVGPGELGRLHTDPILYEAVLGKIDSPRLVVSTKYQEGDFFSFLPPNPTLAGGPHRRIIEFQARREFEGFAAFPDYMAVPHQRALRELLSRNPRIIGAWLWTQEGGPLRAGPLSLYPLRGFWLWDDANVYVTSRLVANPEADVTAVTRSWVAREISDDSEVVAVVSRILLASREAVERGFYIRPFGERRVRIAGVDVPPLLWIMEWDQVGGWVGAMSTIFVLAEGDLDTAIQEGFEAARSVTGWRRALEGVEGRLVHAPGLYERMHRSLLYEETLLTALARYRSAFLNHYRWLASGDPAAFDRWRRSALEYGPAREEHEALGKGDTDFPAFDFAAADEAIALGHRTRPISWLARTLLVPLVGLLAAGLPVLQRGTPSRPGKGIAHAVWTGIVCPARVGALDGTSIGGTAGVLLVYGLLTLAALSSFASWRLVGATTVLLAVLVVGLRLGAGGRAWAAVPALAPWLLVAASFLGVMSVRGPAYFWLLFWSTPAFRIVVVALVVAAAVWSLLSLFAAGVSLTGGRVVAVGGLLTAAGLTLLVAGLLVPDTEALLLALHSPLVLLPLTHAVVLGILTYLGVPATLAPYLVGTGVLLLGSGLVLARRGAARSVSSPS